MQKKPVTKIFNQAAVQEQVAQNLGMTVQQFSEAFREMNSNNLQHGGWMMPCAPAPGSK